MSVLAADGADGVSAGVLAGASNDDEPTPWEKHPAFQILFHLYREHGCPATVDPLDPEDCAGVAAASVRALMQAGWLVDETEFQYAAVVNKERHGGGWEVVRIRDTFDRADCDRDLLAVTGICPVTVMRRRRSSSRANGQWEAMTGVAVGGLVVRPADG